MYGTHHKIPGKGCLDVHRLDTCICNTLGFATERLKKNVGGRIWSFKAENKAGTPCTRTISKHTKLMEMETFHGELMDHILVSWKAIFFQLSLSSLWHLKTARSAKPGVATPTAPGSLGGESLSFQRKNEWHVC